MRNYRVNPSSDTISFHHYTNFRVDNRPNTALLHADLDGYIGKIDFQGMEDLGGDSETIATTSTAGNLPLGIVCAVDSTTIYGVLVTRDAITGETVGMDMTVRLTVELPQYDLFYGYIEEIAPHPNLLEQDCIITAVDGIDFLSRHDANTTLYQNILTGAAHNYILDDALWNLDMRLVDAGQDTIPYWFANNVKARFAQGEIDDNEQGFSIVDGAGHYRFEDRHHRDSAEHQTSQASFDNTMAGITYSLNPRNVFNEVKVTVTPWELQVEAELWRLEETPSIDVGQTLTWWGDSQYFVGAWVTPVVTTDYTANSLANGTGTNMTTDIAITTTKFARTIKLDITNNGTVPAFITLLKARGTWYDDQTKTVRKTTDSTSQTAYQKRTYELDGKYMTDADKAQDYADYAIGKYKDPRGQLTMTVINQDTTTLAQILALEISDRITVDNDKLGIDGDYFIDYMQHDISQSGIVHTVTYRLADCTNEDFWCLDFSALGSQTKLGY
jgi:hypothetical protein